MIAVTDMFSFAYFPSWLEQLDTLAEMALPEPWRFRDSVPIPERKNSRTPILEKYVHSVFRACCIEHQGAASASEADATFLLRQEYACINTGLLSRTFLPIYAYFEKNKRVGYMREWYFKGFQTSNSGPLHYINPLPRAPFQNIKTQIVTFWADWPIRVNTDHILGTPENVLRIPEEFRSFGNLPLLLETAVEVTRRYASVMPSIIVPQRYAGKIQFLLPLCLKEPNTADLAMTVTVMEQYYVCTTCLSIDMAYCNARLLAQPTAPWLTALVE